VTEPTTGLGSLSAEQDLSSIDIPDQKESQANELGALEDLRAPFPWFGGKRRVASIVWKAFDPSINNYIEPFAGSLAVLLRRPGGPGKIETVNDIDCYLSNFWRAVQLDPEAVAQWADWPVNEADLHARHRWLVSRAEFRERMLNDPDYFDAKVAGWWVYGICCWIGGGWCGGIKRGEPRPNLNSGQGVHTPDERRPHVSGTHPGMGVHTSPRRPAVMGEGRGVHLPDRTPEKIPYVDARGSGSKGVHMPTKEQLPYVDALGNGSRGVHMPSLGNDRGIFGVAAPPHRDWFLALHQRLRRVRVVCGDWSRVVTPSVLGKGRNVGGRRPTAVLLDPPYSHDFRDKDLYSEDDASISAAVRKWAIENGDDPELRIALCGYVDEHPMPDSWTVYRWKGARGYAGAENANRDKECIWFSQGCNPIEDPKLPTLFDRFGA
jgi:hypothetical protein